MLELSIKVGEKFNEETNEFIPEVVKVELEHSLLAASKWEAKYEIPFLDDKHEKSEDQLLDYIKMMIVTPGFSPDLFEDLLKKLPSKEARETIETINNYISKKQTATWFNDKNSKPNRETITTELIYYWMFSSHIPKECEEWNLNRLLTLIKIVSIKSQPEKKMSRAEVMKRNQALNAQRRAKFKTRG